MKYRDNMTQEELDKFMAEVKALDAAYAGAAAHDAQVEQEQLIAKVIEQIKKDLESEDVTAIAELLTNVATKHLKGFLPEEEFDYPEQVNRC